MTEETANIHVETVLDELVRQFSDPVACFRELVQNALDAGTPRIAIDFDWREPETDGDRGTMVVEIRDWGEGMDRSVIENRLTRLFSSAKDDDYTKIGRFGIGFVSVFALEPVCVCVDTGRSGEYWRVLFDGRRSFELLSLDRPVEGTRVRIFKHLDEPAFDAFRRRAREAVTRWCKHARSPILFEGTDLREPFEVDAVCTTGHREEGTRLVVGLSTDDAPPCGYYNRGLTLREFDDGPWPHVTFKIDSRYLEHTITRDQLLEDADFRKATNLLERQIRRDLPARLLDQLEATADRPDAADRHDRLCAGLTCYLDHYPPPEDWRRRPVVPTVGGGPVSIEACRTAAREGRLVETPPDRHPARFSDSHIFVPASRREGLRTLLDSALEDPLVPLHDRFARLREVGSDHLAGADWPELAERLLRRLDVDIAGLTLARFRSPSPLDGAVAATAPNASEWVRADDVVTGLDDLRDAHVYLACEHPAIRAALAAAASEPEWAAYSLVLALSRGGLIGDERADVIATALAIRAERRGVAGV